MTSPPPPIQQPQPNWWDRNWKWFVPTGCFTLLAVTAVFITAIVLLVAGIMKSSDAYKEAVAIARANPALREALGTPIEEAFFVTGNVNVTGGTGHADLGIRLSGPKDKAHIHVVGNKTGGRWTFSTLVAGIDDTGESINLLE